MANSKFEVGQEVSVWQSVLGGPPYLVRIGKVASVTHRDMAAWVRGERFPSDGRSNSDRRYLAPVTDADREELRRRAIIDRIKKADMSAVRLGTLENIAECLGVGGQ